MGWEGTPVLPPGRTRNSSEPFPPWRGGGYETFFLENLGARYMSIFKLWRGSNFFSKVRRGYENDFSRFPVKLKKLSGTPHLGFSSSCCFFATEFTKINPKIQKRLSPPASIKNGPLYIYITLNFYFYLKFSVNFKNDSFRLTISPNLLDPNELMTPRNEW